jgi:hypothetical protein
MKNSRKFCLTAQLSFLIVTLTRRDAAVSFAVTAQEHADDAGDDFPVLRPSCHDVLPCTVPLPHESPVPHAGGSPLATGITRDPSLSTRQWLKADVRATHAEITGPRASDLSHGRARHVVIRVGT